MVKLTDDQYWAYRKAHTCPIPKEDLEAQMFVGVAGSIENTQADRNVPDTFIGTECGDKEPEPVIGISCPDYPGNVFVWLDYQPGCTGLGENVKYSTDKSKFNKML